MDERPFAHTDAMVPRAFESMIDPLGRKTYRDVRRKMRMRFQILLFHTSTLPHFTLYLPVEGVGLKSGGATLSVWARTFMGRLFFSLLLEALSLSLSASDVLKKTWAPITQYIGMYPTDTTKMVLYITGLGELRFSGSIVRFDRSLPLRS